MSLVRHGHMTFLWAFGPGTPRSDDQFVGLVGLVCHPLVDLLFAAEKNLQRHITYISNDSATLDPLGASGLALYTENN